VIRVVQETETDRGWAFRVAIDRAGEPETEHVLRLSWMDYDYWSRGVAPPVRIAEAIFRFLEEKGEKPPASCDAATLRRRFREFDRELDQYL
jgi:hypothetical protein